MPLNRNARDGRGLPNLSSKDTTRVNERIRVREVRLVDQNGAQVGVVPIDQALKMATEASLDLVEVAPSANPPVCRIMDFAKFKYEKAKQDRENRQHQRATAIKELRFRPQIDDHDYQTKLRALMRFLEKGNKVKVTLVFRGREMTHQEFGHRLLERLKTDVEKIAQIERPPMQEGRFVFMTISPR